MKRSAFISLILTALFLVSPSNSFASNSLSAAPGTTSTPTSRSSAQPEQADRPSLKKVEQPPTAILVARDQKLFLELNKNVNRVEILARGKNLGALGKGSIFDITRYLRKTQANKLEFRFPDFKNNKGKPHSTTLSVARFQTKFANEQKARTKPAPAIIPARIAIQNISLKDNRIQVQIRKTGEAKFANREFVVGKLVLEHQGREHSFPLMNMCTLSQLNLGRNLVLGTGLVLTEKSRVTINFKRIAVIRPRTVTLNPVQMAADDSLARVIKSDDFLVKTVSPRPIKSVELTPPAPNVPPPPPPGPGDAVPYDRGHPDLALTLSIKPVDPAVEWYSSIQAKITVKNVGGVAPSAETTFDLWVSDDPSNYYGRTLISFYDENIPELEPGVKYIFTKGFNIPETHDDHRIIPGTFRLATHLNTEGLALGEEENSVNNEDEVIFQLAKPASYDLVLKGISLTQDNRLKIIMKNEGPDISPVNHAQLRLAVSINDGAFKALNMTTVDPTGILQVGTHLPGWSPNQTSYTFVWPTTSSQGLELFAPEMRYKVLAKIGHPMSDGDVSFGHDTNTTNNSKTVYVGGKPDLVVCFKKYNHHTHGNQTVWYPPVVKNIGNAPSGSSTLRFYIQGKGGKNYTVPSLPAGGEYKGIQRKIYWVLQGTRSFKLEVDINDDVDEGDGEGEHNNIMEGMIYVSTYGHSPVPITCSGTIDLDIDMGTPDI